LQQQINSPVERHHWFDDVGLHIRFSAVLQGGGIRGLFFPGHFYGLRKLGVDKINAFAGASAGSLVAVGLWSGLSPHKLLRELTKRSGVAGLLFAIMSPADIGTVIFRAIIACVVLLLNVAITIFWIILCKSRSCKEVAPVLTFHTGCSGERLESFINDIIIAGLEARSFRREYVEHTLQKDIRRNHITFEDIIRLTNWTRFVSGISSKDDPDLDLVRQAYGDITEVLERADFSLHDAYGLPRNDIIDLTFCIHLHSRRDRQDL
jgi:hypothetical protein